jgi:hypothetical protein
MAKPEKYPSFKLIVGAWARCFSPTFTFQYFDISFKEAFSREKSSENT